MAAVHPPISIPSTAAEKWPAIIREVELPDTPSSTTSEGEPLDPERHIIVSPYTDAAHLLDLETLDQANQLLTRALTHLRCLRPDYATAPYLDTFNWSEVIDVLRSLVRETGYQWKETSFYIVAFRSQIPPTTVYAELGALDKASHAEATASGGLLKYVQAHRPLGLQTRRLRYDADKIDRYWFGTPDSEGRNLATCLWRNKDDAKRGGVGPAHRKASAATRSLYSAWKIDRHRLVVHDDVASWEIVDWVD
jgi:hypothetical protein